VDRSGAKGRILGEYQHSLDAKGRLAIPARFRSAFTGGSVVTRGVDSCLVLFPPDEWDAFAAQIDSLPNSQADVRQVARAMFTVAAEVELDSLGRINIPQKLRAYAGLNGEAILAGVGSRLEIWQPDRWEAGRAAREDIANQFERFGI
jgi:MraZ protein